MARLAVRQNGSCPANAQWYVCAAGGFKGCCSVDPCTTGVCPDESGSSGSSGGGSSSSSSLVDAAPTMKDEPVSLTTLVQEPATSTISTSSALSSTPTSSSETSTEAPSSVKSTSTASRASSTTMATTTSSTSTRHPTTTLASTTSTAPTQSTTQASLAASQDVGTWHPTAALIGGTVAGAVGLVLLVVLLVFCVQRARKRRHQTFTLLRWRSIHNSKPESQNGTSPRPPPTARTRRRRSTSPLPKYTHHTHTHKHKHKHSHSHTPSLPNFTFPDSTPSYPYKKNRAAELSDTGFYRPRAELPAQSSRELINIPVERGCRWDCDGGDVASDMIVTADGAVLRATIKTVEADSPFAVYDGDGTRDGGPPVYSGIEYGMSGGCGVWGDDSKNKI
ncbi:uncharacterized protein AKAW2_11059S [Aspergillus luchuensis]|uniref:Uncharacterized protein n=1 Tax=Aspergillus kawachii TaxID=1069201 RepID=A0A7R8A562_ASPKA|nr:uncharacterized protein AKAW2_11059S [Aspergillus luchuensis]BCR94013.1 hypothetical protein AKAW2_11059S [Aspergillus luchuensis]BCS06624.1 hypothetical protein ALUC_11005S [Aspergillus luchuensis]GAA84358.1 similar to An02g12780 [Aspergillus luchuensis IFO 4308]